MASSIVSYKQNFFWCGDNLLEVIIYFLVSSLKELSKNKFLCKENEQWFERYNERLLYYLKGFSSGSIDLEIDDLSKDFERLLIFRLCLCRVKAIILAKGDFIAVSELNEIEMMKADEDEWSLWKVALKADRVVDIIDKIFSLLPAGVDR